MTGTGWNQENSELLHPSKYAFRISPWQCFINVKLLREQSRLIFHLFQKRWNNCKPKIIKYQWAFVLSSHLIYLYFLPCILLILFIAFLYCSIAQTIPPISSLPAPSIISNLLRLTKPMVQGRLYNAPCSTADLAFYSDMWQKHEKTTKKYFHHELTGELNPNLHFDISTVHPELFASQFALFQFSYHDIFVFWSVQLSHSKQRALNVSEPYLAFYQAPFLYVPQHHLLLILKGYKIYKCMSVVN